MRSPAQTGRAVRTLTGSAARAWLKEAAERPAIPDLLRDIKNTSSDLPSVAIEPQKLLQTWLSSEERFAIAGYPDLDHPLGICVFSQSQSIVEYIGLKQEHRRSGIGARLLAAVLMNGDSKAEASCFVDANNVPSRNFFASRGFELQETSPLWIYSA